MRKCIVVLMVCLMATSAFATVSWKNATTGEWSLYSNWSTSGTPVDTDGQVKIVKDGSVVNLSNYTTPVFNASKVTLGGTSTSGWCTINVNTGGALMLGTEFQIGNSSASSNGAVVQTGGTVDATSTTTTAKIEVGYKAGIGTYTISGGTISSGTMTGTSPSQLIVGGAGSAGSVGTFTVVGSAATINIGRLYLGVKDSTGGYPGTGTLDFEVASTGVSKISTGNAITIGGGGSVANLIVNLTGTAPVGTILLVENTGTGAVLGSFSNYAWGATITLGGVNYTLSNVYDSATHTNGAGNDIALIPEPITLALLGFGFLAIRRNRK